jgi:hypothetical protein
MLLKSLVVLSSAISCCQSSVDCLVLDFFSTLKRDSSILISYGMLISIHRGAAMEFSGNILADCISKASTDWLSFSASYTIDDDMSKALSY